MGSNCNLKNLYQIVWNLAQKVLFWNKVIQCSLKKVKIKISVNKRGALVAGIRRFC